MVFANAYLPSRRGTHSLPLPFALSWPLGPAEGVHPLPVACPMWLPSSYPQFELGGAAWVLQPPLLLSFQACDAHASAVGSAALPEPLPFPCLLPLPQAGLLHMASQDAASRH